MRIFKNRGDIYISRSGYKGSKEERILVLLLAVIVIITSALLIFLNLKYDKVSDFFAEGEITTTEKAEIDDILPSISGKTNYLVMETDDQDTNIHYIFLVQGDNDNLAYKVCTLSPDMKINDKSIKDIYFTGGGAALQKSLTEYFGFEIDYHLRFENSDFINFLNSMGSVIYPFEEEIKYDGGKGDDTYSIRVSQGEQKIDASQLSNILRYYSQDNINYETANEIILYGLTQLFCEDNFNKADLYFRKLLNSSTTNITVRDFEDGKNVIYTFCKKNSDVIVYSVNAGYENKELTPKSEKEIKGYFTK